MIDANLATPLWAWAATPILAAMLWRIARSDIAALRIPDRLSLPLIPGGIAVAWIAGAPAPGLHLLGAALGWGSFALIGAVFYRLRGVDGLGRGDAKLMGAAGAWLGAQTLPLVVLAAASGALAFALLSGRDRMAPIAFGPWICAAFFALWCARLTGLG